MECEQRAIERPRRRQDRRLRQPPHRAAGLGGARPLQDPVHRPPRGLVGALHRGQVGVGSNVVRGQHEVLYRGRRLRPVLPGAGGVDQQGLEVRRLGRVRVDDVWVEEPAEHVRVVEDIDPGVVEASLELGPDLVAHLLASSRTSPACRARCPWPPNRRRRPRGCPPPVRHPSARGPRRPARTAPARSRSGPRESRCRGCVREPGARRGRGRT